MMEFMKRKSFIRRKLLAVALVAAMLGMAPMSARADDNAKSYDGRLDDYNSKSVTLDNGGAALTYFVWVLLGAVGLIVLFKDAKRTHLD
jgi:hypothetical protein